MANTYTKLNLHIVFHVKRTRIRIRIEDLPTIFKYIGGIISNIGGIPLVVGGISNHIHILAIMPKTMNVTEFVRVIKANSSKWIKTLDDYYESFAWQEGYGAFTVSSSAINVTKQYIENQAKHHHEETVVDEYKRLLNENGIEYDERYIFDD